MTVNAEKHPAIKSFLIQILLVISGAFFFSLANPGFLFPKGLSLFAWCMYVPVLLCVHRASYRTVWLWGGIYGVVSYGLYIFWLFTFSTVAMTAVSFKYFILCSLLFIALKAADSLCGKGAAFVQGLTFCAYEYIKTLGFVGFSYGVAGYTQWKNVLLLQSSALTGVWGITALVVFSSVIVYCVVRDAHCPFSAGALWKSVRHHCAGMCVWTFCLAAALVYGAVVLKTRLPGSGKTVKVCAVQNNSDPWKGGVEAYERDTKELMRLTDQALQTDSDIKLVVWPETAVVPSIIMQYSMRNDRKRFEIVTSVLKYINRQSAVFVIGNFHSVDSGGEYYDDYNCAFVFKPGVNVIPPEPELYAKIHLVPFTESFPYGKQFPYVYKLLLKGDTHLWSPGTERKVFHQAGLSFSVPICFEDTFGDDCRKFVLNGARAFINMSNDAWSGSLACQNQHLAMAVFRSAEKPYSDGQKYGFRAKRALSVLQGR